jgi:hypothetical protein
MCLICPIYLQSLTTGCYRGFVSDCGMDWKTERIEHAAGVNCSETEAKSPGVDRAAIDEIVVKRVFDCCHLHIAEAVSGITLPAEFLGALTANESGGRCDAACFEPAVYEHLKAVASGRAPAFGSIAWQQLSSALQEATAPGARQLQDKLANEDYLKGAVRALTGQEDRGLRDLATSWGFTQIMGYHVIGRKVSVPSLADPRLHYHLAIDILEDFARRFRLQLSRDFESLFRCWNTGRPAGKTFDPDYVAKGIRRMNLYRSLMPHGVENHLSHATFARGLES